MSDTREIPLPCGRVAIVPASEYERLSQYTWYYASTLSSVKASVGRGTNKTTIQLHREVMGNPHGLTVRARDKNYLNCTFDNLYIGGKAGLPWTPETERELLALREQGLSKKEIAQHMDRSELSIERRLELLDKAAYAAAHPDVKAAWVGTKVKPNWTDMEDAFKNPIVHVDIVTGQVLAWREWNDGGCVGEAALAGNALKGS